MKKQIVALLGLAVFSISAQATPGDVQCTGTTTDGKKVEVLKLYDNFQQNGPSGAIVTLEGKEVAKFSSELETGYVNVGTENDPFMNYQETGKDGDDVLTLRYPEQSPDEDTISVYLTLDAPSSKTKLSEVELQCVN